MCVFITPRLCLPGLGVFACPPSQGGKALFVCVLCLFHDNE